MRFLKRFIPAVLALTIFSCTKATEDHINAPYITGVATTDIHGQYTGSIGNPNIKDSIVHSSGVNRFAIYPNPVSFTSPVLNVRYKVADTVAMTTTIVAAFYSGHPETKNDSLFGHGAVMEYAYIIPANEQSTSFHLGDTLPAGYYRIYVVLKAATYTDSLYENIWIQ